MNIIFTELNFAGYERKHKIVVDQYKVTKNQNGTYNIICNVAGKQYIYNDCTYPKEENKMGEYVRLNNMLQKEQEEYNLLKVKSDKTEEDIERMIDLSQSIGEIEGALLEMAEIDGLDDPYEAFDY